MLQTDITGVCGECSQCLGHTGFAPTHGVCAFPVYTAQALGCFARNCLRPALGCVHFPGLSHSGSGSWDSTKAQSWLGLPFVPFPGPSSSGDQVLGEHPLPRWEVHLAPLPSQLLSFLGAQREHHFRCSVCLLWGANLCLQPSWQ